MLIEAGALIGLRDAHGRLPEEVARANDYAETARFLSEASQQPRKRMLRLSSNTTMVTDNEGGEAPLPPITSFATPSVRISQSEVSAQRDSELSGSRSEGTASAGTRKRSLTHPNRLLPSKLLREDNSDDAAAAAVASAASTIVRADVSGAAATAVADSTDGASPTSPSAIRTHRHFVIDLDADDSTDDDDDDDGFSITALDDCVSFHSRRANGDASV